MIQLAMPDTELKRKLMEAQMRPQYSNMPMLMDAKQEPSLAQRAGSMMLDRTIDKGLQQVGKEGLKKGLATAGAAAGGPMGAIAGEVAGELAAPLLKDFIVRLFNHGGFVGPLSPKYKAGGGMMSNMPMMDANDTMMGLMRLYGMR